MINKAIEVWFVWESKLLKLSLSLLIFYTILIEYYCRDPRNLHFRPTSSVILFIIPFRLRMSVNREHSVGCFDPQNLHYFSVTMEVYECWKYNFLQLNVMENNMTLDFSGNIGTNQAKRNLFPFSDLKNDYTWKYQ